ncbi:hypothetical protein TrCOL_g431 [Triparma columacea]|uniref:Uncharacterized protein n=1 Tax=Triparma columacea TaxID=722753 RepID=A0A9W7GGM0_9STRA|nr:hypothetical protein TrCOL_g431 [Triparma columacea]
MPTNSNLGATAESTVDREAVSLLSIGNFIANETEDHRSVAIERAADQPITPDITPSIIEDIIKQNKQLLAANGALTKANGVLMKANGMLTIKNEVLEAKVETLARENEALKASSPAKGGEATEGERASGVVTERVTLTLTANIATESGEVGDEEALALGEEADGGEGGGITVFDDRIRQDFERRLKIVEKVRKFKIDSLTKTMVLFDVFQPGVRAEEGGKGWGRASVNVRAGFEEVAAFFWDVNRLDKTIKRLMERERSSFEMEVRKILLNSNLIEQVKSKIGRQSTSVNGRSNTSKLDSHVSKLGDMAADREFFSRMNLYRADEKTIVIISRPVSEIEEASETTAIRISNVGEKKSSVDLITKIELGKAVSRRAARVSAKKLLGTTSDAAYYFDNLLGCAEAVEEDGRRFGEQLMEMVKGEKGVGIKDGIVSDFIENNVALGELVKQHEFVGTMLRAIVRNKMKRDAAKEGGVESENEAHGWKIGSALKVITITTATANHAVDEWAHQYNEVEEVMRDYKWFRPMIETIAVNLFKNSKIGLKARVTFGAVTSMTDLLTDVYVTYMFRRGKEYWYFKASLASLVMSIGLQMLMVWVQNRKLGMKRVVRECIPILLGYKPAVDAYRVATGAKQEVGTALEPMLELTVMKVLEMFAEAIPGVIIQLMAIATSDKDVGVTAWLSVAVSAITTGFASATISYDWDTDPGKRELAPNFYGYIPAKASKRTVVFVSMLLFTAGMLLIRCTTIVLLGLMGGSWAFLYIGADLSLYILFKILRGDFWYWLRLGGNIEIVSSIITRVIVKIIVDFTSIAHLRHPNEVGGAYWLFGLVLTMCVMIKWFVGFGGGRLRVREGGVWGESRAKVEVSRMKAGAERVREMAREEIKKLREEEDMIIGEKFEWEGKRGEVRGMYWMFGFVLTMGSLPAAIVIAERGDVADKGLAFAWKVVGIFIPCTVLLFAVFFFSIEKKYWGTFYSLQRGKDLTVKNFRNGTDAGKADAAFDTSKHHWKSIEEDVRTWVEANWVRWEEEKPEWFDEAMRARVPVEYIPGAGDARRRESVRRASVDTEAEGGLAGAVRASIRRTSVGGTDGGVIGGVGGGEAKVSSVMP